MGANQNNERRIVVRIRTTGRVEVRAGTRERAGGIKAKGERYSEREDSDGGESLSSAQPDPAQTQPLPPPTQIGIVPRRRALLPKSGSARRPSPSGFVISRPLSLPVEFSPAASCFHPPGREGAGGVPAQRRVFASCTLAPSQQHRVPSVGMFCTAAPPSRSPPNAGASERGRHDSGEGPPG